MASKHETIDAYIRGCSPEVDLSRFDAAPVAHLSDLSFEGQGAFPAKG